MQITIYDLILDFEAFPRFVPHGGDEETDEPSEGYGKEKLQFPIDRNITFVFDFLQGRQQSQ